MRRLHAIALLVVLGAALSCRLYNLERRLDPVNADFLSRVRYIISREERRAFLGLPDPQKPSFIEEFWKRRDPDPSTENNEFKDEYDRRLDIANELFLGEGIPGWLTDRGRVYILFGPPTNRSQGPGGANAPGVCREIWYYGDFPVVFVDPSCTGHFGLVTYDLTPLPDINRMSMPASGSAQDEARRPERDVSSSFFNFSARIRPGDRKPESAAATVVLDIPFRRIWFVPTDKTLRTTLTVAVELRDVRNNLVLDLTKDYPLDFKEAELEQKAGTAYIVEIPVVLDDPAVRDRLDREGGTLTVAVTNSTGGGTVRKVLAYPRSGRSEAIARADEE